jgi:hypothetical protein
MTHIDGWSRRRLLGTAAAFSVAGAAGRVAGAADESGYGAAGYGSGPFGDTDRPSPVGPADAAPTDPDGDGVYEDVDGDGELTVADVQVLYAALDSAAVQEDPRRFDVDGDGDADRADALALFRSL